MSSSLPRVLVTGATGFIGSRVAADLAATGRWSVRCGVRDAAAAKDPQSDYFPRAKHLLGIQPPVELVTLDIGSAESFGTALEGCSALVHVASPINSGKGMSISEEEVDVAITATQVALQSAAHEAQKGQAGQEKKKMRVVVTSSMAAICGAQREKDPNHLWVESDNNDDPGSNYSRSKTLAHRESERLAHGELADSIELATIHPAVVFGPSIAGQDPASTSASMIMPILDGTTKAAGGLFAFKAGAVDVRDVSEAHVAALEKPEAAGQRYLLSVAGQFHPGSVSDALIKAAPEWKEKIATEWKEGVEPPTLMEKSTDNSKVVALLGHELKSLDETIADFVADLKAGGFKNDA